MITVAFPACVVYVIHSYLLVDKLITKFIACCSCSFFVLQVMADLIQTISEIVGQITPEIVSNIQGMYCCCHCVSLHLRMYT